MGVVGESISIVTSVTSIIAQTVAVVTTVQNSRVSFSLSLTFSTIRSKAIVRTISPAVTVGKTSMGIVGETITIVASVTSIIAQTVAVVTTVQNSWVSLSLGLSLWGSLDGTKQSNRQQDFHDAISLYRALRLLVQK